MTENYCTDTHIIRHIKNFGIMSFVPNDSRTEFTISLNLGFLSNPPLQFFPISIWLNSDLAFSLPNWSHCRLRCQADPDNILHPPPLSFVSGFNFNRYFFFWHFMPYIYVYPQGKVTLEKVWKGTNLLVDATKGREAESHSSPMSHLVSSLTVTGCHSFQLFR